MASNDQNYALIRAVRSLDQSSAESIPDTLSNLWTLLSTSMSGPFQASEEIILRWLLKNMTGTAETAEPFRRYPLVWNIMACVFNRIPLISLAKSLADRRFVSTLQQTLKEISNPENNSIQAKDDLVDVEMTDADGSRTKRTSKKRKRTQDVSFELYSLKSSYGSLKSAEALFEALRVLLTRVESIDVAAPVKVQMGAEHVKSLFCAPIKEALDLLRPMLLIFDLSLQEEDAETFENQSTWPTVFASLWNLHLQSDSDAVEVAMSLYPTGSIVLAKMDRSRNLLLDPHVKATWTRDLRRFFIKSMILPSRAAFLNHKDIAIMKAAAEVTNFMATASYPVLYSLAVKAPHSVEDATSRREYDDWTQKIFEILEEPMRSADPIKRNQAIKVILAAAQRDKTSISLDSLRAVCVPNTTPSAKMDLDIIARVADLNIDAFLIGKEGNALLDNVLGQLTDIKNTDFDNTEESNATAFIVALAKGFSVGRDLSGFIKKWFGALVQCTKGDIEYLSIAKVWSSQVVNDVVTSLLQSSMNTRQLTALLSWLENEGANSEPRALLTILDAISQGLTEEEFIDAVDLRIYDMISKLKLKTLSDSDKARWWHIVETTVSVATSEEVAAIWTEIEADLKKTLKKADMESRATIAAFHCCSCFWLANYAGGPHETQAASMATSFIKKQGKGAQQTAGLQVLQAPRLIDLLAKSETGKKHLSKIITHMGATLASATEDVDSILYNEANLNNRVYSNGLVSYAMDTLSEQQEQGSKYDPERVLTALRILLDLPAESLTREHREQIMPKVQSLFADLPLQKPANLVALMEMSLSLMVNMMKRPTFYHGIKFGDLVTLGDTILGAFQLLQQDFLPLYHCLKLLEALASNTLKQMTSNIEQRERSYLEEAAQMATGWSDDSTNLQPHRYVLLKAVIVALESSKSKQLAADAVAAAALKKTLSLMAVSILTSQEMLEIESQAAWLEKGVSSWCMLVTLEQLDVVEPTVLRSVTQPTKAKLEIACATLRARGLRAGWRLQELLYRCSHDAVPEPLNIQASDVFTSRNTDDSVPLSIRSTTNDAHMYIDAVLGSMDEESRDFYVDSLEHKLLNDSDITGHLLALDRLIRAATDSPLQASLQRLDLSKLHSILASRVLNAQSSWHFSVIAQTIHMLLDKKANTMKQWNVELTLSTVSVLCAGGPASATEARGSLYAYELLAQLVEVIIKRHRLRLEGHFHLLITSLQSLLRLLISPMQSSSSVQSVSTSENQEKRAQLYSRLLTLVCEPSVASVTRGQQQGLDSATAAAKRSAGQHMYLILILYIKLQLEHAISSGVRAALEPGVYSILDITTQEGRRTLNEAVDGSGRAIFREMYRRYVKFGKWSGV
ncbi:Urb2/Npa2 family-domain-containing protein [Coniella lustricola]|uniref:Urb2/Npa2 family-domain-containing protein n=1 Tax=Coniella lustricola TaxID=2025994 RepID=A0A2T3AEN8_9PEZI|nr:Urb2/Npa2 family-domain-containing protein [Coniella lustricola]